MADKLIIAKTAEEAVRAKTKDNIYLAGGTEVMRLGSEVKGDSFVSLRKVPYLHEIRAEGGSVIIGAGCTFQEIVESDIVPDYLKEAALFMASRTKRNMATIGGNIALSRDDSYLLPVLIVVDAMLKLKDAKSEEDVSVIEYISASDKFDGKLITEVCVPKSDISVKSVRSSNTAQSHARLTAALALKDGKYTAAAAVKNSGIYKFAKLTQAMENENPTEDDIVALVKADGSIKLEDDLLYGGADYRRYLIGIHFALMYEELKGGRA